MSNNLPHKPASVIYTDILQGRCRTERFGGRPLCPSTLCFCNDLLLRTPFSLKCGNVLCHVFDQTFFSSFLTVFAKSVS